MSQNSTQLRKLRSLQKKLEKLNQMSVIVHSDEAVWRMDKILCQLTEMIEEA